MAGWDSYRDGTPSYAEIEAGEIALHVGQLLEPFEPYSAPHIVVIPRRDPLDIAKIAHVGLDATAWALARRELYRYRNLITCYGSPPGSEDGVHGDYDGWIASIHTAGGELAICRHCAHMLSVSAKRFEHVGDNEHGARVDCAGCGKQICSVNRVERDDRDYNPEAYPDDTSTDGEDWRDWPF